MSTIKSSAENLTLNADGANNDIKFQSNGSEVASIDQAGLISAGGATLTGNVTATGLGRFNTTSYTPVTNGEKVSIEGTSAWQQSLSFSMWGAGTYNSSYASGAIGVANSNSKIHISGGAQVVGNPAGSNWAKTLSATSASFNTLGNGESSWYTDASLTANTAYTPTERVRIHNNGVTSFNNGVALGVGLANTASNVIDDYEEGTWTLTDQSGASLSLSVYIAMYTKIGRKVFFEIGMQFPTTSSTALVKLSLPFTAKSGDDNTGGAFITGTNSGRDNDLWLVNRGTPAFQVGNSLNSEGHSTQAKNSHYSGKQLKLCGSYTV